MHVQPNLNGVTPGKQRTRIWSAAWIAGIPVLVLFVVLAILTIAERAPAQVAKTRTEPRHSVQTSQQKVTQGAEAHN